MAREQRLVFGEVADVYDRTRPSYPESLVDEVISYARLGAGDPVLESGCGTGKATVPFARRALRMTALEPDSAMAAIAQRNCASLDVSVEITSFEDWVVPPRAAFSLVMAAQSWHWVQPGVRLRKAHEVLVDDGALALFWNRPDWPETALRHEIDAAYERVVPELGARMPGKSPQEVGRRACVEELAASGLFGEITATEHAWETAYERDAYLELLDTQSDHRLLDPVTRERLFAEVGRAIDDAGGTFPVSYVAELYVARRAG
jgi:SAM-dependent methyltransferase